MAEAQRPLTLRRPRRLIAARRRPTPRARLHYPPRLASEHDGPPSKGLPQSLSGKTPWPRPSLARQRALPLRIGSITMQAALRRRAAHNGLELSCPAARATPAPFSRILAGESRSSFPHASRVSCSELLCVPQIKTRPHRHDLFHHFLHPLAPAASRLPSRATVLDLRPPPADLPPPRGRQPAGPSLACLAPTCGQDSTHRLTLTHPKSTTPPERPHFWPHLPPLDSPSPARDHPLAPPPARLWLCRQG